VNPLIECLGWTLVNFVWQGAVVALLLAIALRMLRRAPANLRYLAGCVALALMVLAPLVTSYCVAKRAEPAPAVSAEQAPVVVAPTVVTAPAPHGTKLVVAAKPVHVQEELNRRLNSVLPWLVTGWFAGVLALSCRLLAGWLRIRRWKCGATEAFAESWREKLDELARRLSISRPVRLVQSALVEVPTVIGWLRPIILLPTSCMTGLSPQQLESILAHELAHIYRHDYLVNLLQSAVETLLFYHPAVWWVSRRIREERENCCDDIAVKICGDPVAYARALATLEELRAAPAQLALAARGGSLLQRIQRLLGKSGGNASPRAWPWAGAMVVVALMAVGIGLRENRAMASESPGPETFITTFGVYHYTNFGTVRELTIQTNGVYLSASRWLLRSSADEWTWTAVGDWFVYIGKDWHVWAYDGAQGLCVMEADSRSSRTMPLGHLDEIPPDAVLKRLPKELRKTALENATPNSEKRQQFEEMIHDAEGQNIEKQHPQKEGRSKTADASHPESVSDRAVSQITNGRAAILEKLPRIWIPSVEYDSLPLSNVINNLSDQAKLHDLSHLGINFFIVQEKAGSHAGNSIKAGTVKQLATSGSTDAGSVKITIKPALTYFRMSDVLDEIVKGADKPIQYKILDYGIEFSLNPNPPRQTHFETVTGTNRDRGQLTITFTPTAFGPPATSLAQAALDSNAPASSPSPLIPPANLLVATNATFSVAASGTPTLSYQWVFNGTNIAGATHEKPQINIKVKFVEISEAISNSSGFDWVLNDAWSTFKTNQTPLPKFVSPYILKDSNSTTAVELNVTNSIISQSMAILNERQFPVAMRSLERHAGVDILTTPEVTTLDNRQAQIQMLDMITVVVGTNTAPAEGKTSSHFLTENLGLGPIFNVMPKVSDDRLSVKLKMTASVTEFKGYAKVDPPTPQLYGRKLEAEATVPDGQTIVLAGRGPVTSVIMKDKVPVLGDIPLLGRLFQRKSTYTTRKNLLVFVTPTLINADGSRYHFEAELDGKSPSAPPSASRDEAKKTN
jgi:beta-lactamase regulating signal transducer with metallopeptidase domain